MQQSAPQAVSFDVGGTLIAPWPSVGHVYATVAARHGHPNLDPTDLNRRFLAAWRAQNNFNHTRNGWQALVDQTFQGLVDPPPGRTFFPDLYDEFSRPHAWRIFDDVLPTLEELASRGIPLAIVSNWDERLRPLLKALGLSGYFETILISCEVYFSKPSNVIFDHLVRNLGLPPGAILHVGDSVREDVNGARYSGLQSLLLDRLGTAEHGRITSLAQLIERVNETHRAQPAD